jgi:hypothetical protein
MTESAHAAGSDSARLDAPLSLLYYFPCSFFFASWPFPRLNFQPKGCPPIGSPDSCGAHTSHCWKTPTAEPQ